MYVYNCVCARVCAHVCVCVRACVRVCVCACVCVRAREDVHTWSRALVCALYHCVCMSVRVCTQFLFKRGLSY